MDTVLHTRYKLRIAMNRKVAVEVRNLKKSYGSVAAVKDVSFEIGEGEIFGMVGPNGAGKTTTIECIESLREPDGGEISVLGFDPRREASQIRPRIGIQLQQSSLQSRIKVWEALALNASFYSKSLDADVLLERLGLMESRDKAFAKLSGGQKQRLFIALALLHDPELVFLDELTTGLDPHARRSMWDLIRDIRDQGKTVFLTTHFMEEAERLCDRVAIVDHGVIVAIDSPENLIRKLDTDHRVVFNVQSPFDIKKLKSHKTVRKIDQIGDRFVIHGRGDMLIADVVNFLTSEKIRFRDLHTEQPSLEDVFLSLTGHEMEKEGEQ